jgi:hypothetical protein
MTDTQDVVDQASTLNAGFGVLTVQIFPLAFPLLLLCIAPLLPLIVVGLLLAALAYPPLRIIRYIRTRRQRSASRARRSADLAVSTPKPARTHR